MVTAKGLRKLLEGRIADAEKTGIDKVMANRMGRAQFVRELHEQVGLLERDGSGNLVESVDDMGNPRLAKGRLSPYEFSLKEIARAIGGEQFVESFEPGNGPDSVALLEAGGLGIDPTHFLNTNTFTAAVTGLLGAQVMEKFTNAAYIGGQLFETRPTRLNGEKMIGTGGISGGSMDLDRKPGEPHPRTDFGERWITTPELSEKALAIEVTQEAVFYDLTGQVLDTAAAVGDRLGYEKERTQLRVFAGITNSYVYKGTSYNTYQTATPWINDHSNPLVDYADIDDALELFTSMTDPETGREIMLQDVPTIVHDPRRESLWHQVLMATEVRQTTNTSYLSVAPPPTSASRSYNRLSSPILRNLIDTEGGVTLEQAKDWWFIGNPRRAFKWMEAWPLRVRQASANEYTMLDRGLVAAYFANYRGVGAVVEPRYVIRNKN
jgi:hypothetical protein